MPGICGCVTVADQYEVLGTTAEIEELLEFISSSQRGVIKG